MPDLELSRAPHERRLYLLEGVGTLRVEGFASRSARAEADAERWRFTHGGFWRRAIEATDATGTVVGGFQPRTWRRGGAIAWAGRELALRPTSSRRQRYALAYGDRELAVLEGKGWGRRPVRISVDDLGAIDPGLLLFAAFVVRGLAADATSAASAGATASTA